MTDATREQIERDARERIIKMECECPDDFHLLECSVPICFDEFIKGATHQHPIAFEAGKKEGRREALEEAIKMITDLGPLIHRYNAEGLSRQLEALKTDKV